MNSDTILHEGCLDRSLAYLRSEERIGGLGIRTLKDDGALDHGCKRGFPTPSASLYYFLGLDKGIRRAGGTALTGKPLSGRTRPPRWTQYPARF